MAVWLTHCYKVIFAGNFQELQSYDVHHLLDWLKNLDARSHTLFHNRFRRTPVSLQSKGNFLRLAVCISFFILCAGIVPAGAQLKLEEGESGQELTVMINEIEFSGNTVIDTQTLEKVAAPYTNRKLTLEEMSELVDLITITYQEQGYILARAYLPKQDIQAGVLKIAVMEGNIGQIKVSGYTHYNERVIKRYFKKQMDAGVINEQALEKGLLLSSDIPKVKTNVVLKKGEKPGDVDVVIDIQDSSKMTLGFDLSLDYNNFGSEFTSKNRYGMTINVQDHVWGSNMRLRGVSGDEMKDSTLGAADLVVPINSIGTKVALRYLTANYAIGEEFAEFAIEGDTEIWGIELLHSFVREKNMNLIVSLGYNQKYIESTIGDEITASIDDMEEYFAVISFDNLDRFLGKNILSFEAHRGQLFRDDEATPSRFPDVALDSTWEKFNLNVARIQKVYGYTNLLVRGTAQYTDHRIVSIEEMSIGGYGSVRGHDPAIFLGDNGYNFSAELMFAPPFMAEKSLFGQRLAQMVQLAAFYDYGYVFVNDEQEEDEYDSKDLMGVGGGIRIFFKDLFTFRYDIGWPIDKEEGADDLFHYIQFSWSVF